MQGDISVLHSRLRTVPPTEGPSVPAEPTLYFSPSQSWSLQTALPTFV